MKRIMITKRRPALIGAIVAVLVLGATPAMAFVDSPYDCQMGGWDFFGHVWCEWDEDWVETTASNIDSAVDNTTTVVEYYAESYVPDPEPSPTAEPSPTPEPTPSDKPGNGPKKK